MDWKKLYVDDTRVGTFQITESTCGPKLTFINFQGRKVTDWPIIENGLVKTKYHSVLPTHIREALSEYFKDPKAFNKLVNEKLKSPTNSYKDEDGDTVYVFSDVEFTNDLGKTVDNIIKAGYQSWLRTELGSGDGISNKDKSIIYWGADVQDYLPDDWDLDHLDPLDHLGECNTPQTEPVKEESDDNSDDVGMENHEKVDPSKASDLSAKTDHAMREVSDKEIQTKTSEKRSGPRHPLYLCNECHKTFRSMSGVCKCKSTNVLKISETGVAAKHGVTPDDVNPEQLEIGTKHEMEHTDDENEARQIATDHLSEDPDYYTKMKKCGLESRVNEGIRRVETYKEGGYITSDRGFIIRFDDNKEVQVTIVSTSGDDGLAGKVEDFLYKKIDEDWEEEMGDVDAEEHAEPDEEYEMEGE